MTAIPGPHNPAARPSETKAISPFAPGGVDEADEARASATAMRTALRPAAGGTRPHRLSTGRFKPAVIATNAECGPPHRPSQCLVHSVEVSSDGTVGVSYYDFRSNTPSPGLPTDYSLAHSHNAGAAWSEQHVAGPFDMESAPVARGFFLGDYVGLAPVGRNFVLNFITANDGNTANPTDAFVARATAPAP